MSGFPMSDMSRVFGTSNAEAGFEEVFNSVEPHMLVFCEIAFISHGFKRLHSSVMVSNERQAKILQKKSYRRVKGSSYIGKGRGI